MYVQSDQRNPSCQVPVESLHIRGRCRRLGAWTRRFLAAIACCAAAFSGGLNAAGPAPRGDTPPSPLSIDGGFTRETLMEFDAPEPAPFAAVPNVSVEEADQPTHFRHRHRTKRHPQTTQGQPSAVVIKAPPKRNPVESFVYWWNGLIVRTFHTRNGTVLLDKIGAKA